MIMSNYCTFSLFSSSLQVCLLNDLGLLNEFEICRYYLFPPKLRYNLGRGSKGVHHKGIRRGYDKDIDKIWRPPIWFPDNESPLDESPRTITPRTIPPRTIPTRTIPNADNCPPDNSHPDNCQPRQLPPENSHSGEFPTLTIAPSFYAQFLRTHSFYW